jgi:hypothetical protein
MGTMVIAICGCGFSSGGVALGGGRSNHLTNCGFPFFCKACKACKSLFKANMYDSDVVAHTVTPVPSCLMMIPASC